MARRAGGQSLNVVLFHQPAAECELVAGRLIKRIEDLSPGPQVFLGRIVAIQTPPHVQRLRAIGDVHVADGPMARGAAHAFGHVYAVIKVHKIGHRIYPRPGDRGVAPVALTHRLQHRAV